jgi:hypothetical protein
MSPRVLLPVLLLGLPASQARSLEIDSFDDGIFAFSHDASASLRETQMGSMLGGTRIVSLSTSRRQTIVSASVETGSSQLRFDTGSGPTGGLNAGSLLLTYGTGFFDAPSDSLTLDLSGLDRFMIDVLQLQGEGEVLVGLNRPGLGTGSLRVPLTAAGTLVIGFDSANITGDLVDVESIDIQVNALTADFTLAIGGIRVIPEPGPAQLLVLGLGVLALHRGCARGRRAR